MTDLTEQWKKGELPYAEYYIKLAGGEYTNDVWDIGGWQSFNKKGDVVVEVLAPVPSWESWQKHKDVTAKTQIKNCDLEIINAQLKETNEALKAELKEVCDVLIRKCPEMKEWVMLNWKNLYEVRK